MLLDGHWGNGRSYFCPHSGHKGEGFYATIEAEAGARAPASSASQEG